MSTTEKRVLTTEQYDNPTKMPGVHELFEMMMRFFCSSGLGKEEEFRNLRALVPDDWAHRIGRLPILLIPQTPQPTDWEKLMKLVRIGEKLGSSSMSGVAFSDVLTAPAPRSPYLITNVWDGRNLLNLTLRSSFEVIRQTERQPLTVFEGLMLVAFAPILESHNIYAGGSCLVQSTQGETYYPAIYRLADQPALNALKEGPIIRGFGMPSCQERLGPTTE